MSEPGEIDIKHVQQMVEEFTAKVMEHAESVQVFVTGRGERGDSTKSYSHGKGNWHARRGQVAEWSRREDERDREELRMEVADDGDDEDSESKKA